MIVLCLDVLKGTATLLRVSETLNEFSREEKSIINNLFERETRRERILGTIQKEESVVNKGGQMHHAEDEISLEERIQRAEQHYFEVIKTERERRVTQLEKIHCDERDI